MQWYEVRFTDGDWVSIDLLPTPKLCAVIADLEMGIGVPAGTVTPAAMLAQCQLELQIRLRGMR